MRHPEIKIQYLKQNTLDSAKNNINIFEDRKIETKQSTEEKKILKKAALVAFGKISPNLKYMYMVS